MDAVPETGVPPNEDPENEPIPPTDSQALAVEGPVEEFKRRAEIQSAIYGQTQIWIKDNLKEGVDFGCPISKKTGRPMGSGKPFLYKPGAEKVCTLLDVMPVFERDVTTWEMFDKRPGLICFICRLVKMADGTTVIGEGRGCANMDEKEGWTENNCVKIAEKRAQVDAVLRTADLSEIFTQDEDFQEAKSADSHARPSARPPRETARQNASPPAPRPSPAATTTTTPRQVESVVVSPPAVEVSEEIRPHLLELIEEMLASNSRLVKPKNITSAICVTALRGYRKSGNTWEEIENKLTVGIDKIRETLRFEHEGAMDAE